MFNLSIGKITINEKSFPKVMGIINLSAESFNKKSIRISKEDIFKTVKKMSRNGANIIDMGAMSTAPYLKNMISTEEEISRFGNIIEFIKKNFDIPISVDTPRAKVAQFAIDQGVDIINDISGLKYDEEMPSVVSKSKLPIILGAYNANKSKSVSGEIYSTKKLLEESSQIARKYGISENKIIIDPSIGFFRNDGLNDFYSLMDDMPWYIRDLKIISDLSELKSLSKPICISVSHKSFLGHLFNLKTDKRLIPSIVSEIISILNGANIIRTHNVYETSISLTMLQLYQTKHKNKRNS